jgi:hypothetical protein
LSIGVGGIARMQRARGDCERGSHAIAELRGLRPTRLSASTKERL